MPQFSEDFNVGVTVTVEDGSDAIERITGPNGDDWRSNFYGLYTEEEVIRHLAYNCVANGIEDASRLDGWADLPPGEVTMRIEYTDV